MLDLLFRSLHFHVKLRLYHHPYRMSSSESLNLTHSCYVRVLAADCPILIVF